MPPRVVVVGLGPAGGDLVLPAARGALERAPRRFVRTSRHPAVDDLTREGLSFESFDDRYEAAAELPDVYAEIADALVDAARRERSVVYAVPGNPVVAERTVALLRDRADAGEITLEVVPGLSFAELAWARVGVDPVADPAPRVVDARSFAPEAASAPGPLLVAQCDSGMVLSEVKLILLDELDADTSVTVLHHLGLPDEDVRAVALADLDREVVPDHLTSLFVDGAGRSAARELTRLLALAERLRRPGGCPWDAEQSHHSLTRYLLEEAYEVVEAVEALPPDAPAGEADPSIYAALEDELGDLLYQVIFHAVLAQEAGAFTMADVARGIHDKLVRRHPHVFGDVEAATGSDVMRNWEQIKKGEKGETSIVAGITPGLPSLLFVHKLFRKAASVGLDPGSAATALDSLDRSVAALRVAGQNDLEEALGGLLASAVVLARAHGIDAESALRGWAARFRDRFRATEALAAECGVDLAALEGEAVEALWAQSGP